MLTQFPASNDEKYYYLWKIDMSKIKLLDKLSIYSNYFIKIKWYFYWSKTSLTPYISGHSRTSWRSEDIYDHFQSNKNVGLFIVCINIIHRFKGWIALQNAKPIIGLQIKRKDLNKTSFQKRFNLLVYIKIFQRLRINPCPAMPGYIRG